MEGTQETGQGVLETLVSSMTAGGIAGYSYQAMGASPVVVLGPEHAQEIAAAGPVVEGFAEIGPAIQFS